MLTILYHDSHIAVCVKPAGVLSQDAGENSVPQQLKAQLGAAYVAVVHRLDREVGGVMVYALTPEAAAALSRDVQNQKLDKIYRAVLRGVPDASEDVLEDLLFHDKTRNKTYVVDRQRKGVRDAKLDYRVLSVSEDRTLVQVHLHTGRTHQIRVQFASRKLPLVGDGKYGGKDPVRTLGLWSWRLCFRHPVTGRPMTFTQEPPQELPWSLFAASDQKEGHK